MYLPKREGGREEGGGERERVKERGESVAGGGEGGGQREGAGVRISFHIREQGLWG